MSENTKIEWATHTFNPWEGCTKVGPGCDHCYAETRNARFGGGTAINWGPGAPRRRTSVANWRKPMQWQAQAAEFFKANGHRQRVFCASLADVFDNEVPASWREDLFALIAETPDLDWLLLTKRVGNAEAMIQEAITRLRLGGWKQQPWPWPNVWLGATIVNQAEADRDIQKLARTRAAVRFLSIEPMLGEIDLHLVTKTWAPGRCNHCCNGDRCDDPSHFDRARCPHCRGTGGQPVHWVICGGESGPGARPMHPNSARSLRDQCAAAGVPFLFKQWGEWHPASCGHSGKIGAWNGRSFMPGWGDIATPANNMVRAGKTAFGFRLLDGVEHNGFPVVAQS